MLIELKTLATKSYKRPLKKVSTMAEQAPKKFNRLYWNNIDIKRIKLGDIKAGTVPNSKDKFFKLPVEYDNPNNPDRKTLIFLPPLLTTIGGMKDRTNNDGSKSYSLFHKLNRDNSRHVDFRKKLDQICKRLVQLVTHKDIKKKVGLGSLTKAEIELKIKSMVYIPTKAVAREKSAGKNEQNEDGEEEEEEEEQVEDLEKDPSLWLKLKHYTDRESGNVDKASFYKGIPKTDGDGNIIKDNNGRIINKSVVIPWDGLYDFDIEHTPSIHIREIYTSSSGTYIRAQVVSSFIQNLKEKEQSLPMQDLLDEYTDKMNDNPEDLQNIDQQMAFMARINKGVGIQQNKGDAIRKLTQQTEDKKSIEKIASVGAMYKAPNLGSDGGSFEDFNDNN